MVSLPNEVECCLCMLHNTTLVVTILTIQADDAYCQQMRRCRLRAQ